MISWASEAWKAVKHESSSSIVHSRSGLSSLYPLRKQGQEPLQAHEPQYHGPLLREIFALEWIWSWSDRIQLKPHHQVLKNALVVGENSAIAETTKNGNEAAMVVYNPLMFSAKFCVVRSCTVEVEINWACGQLCLRTKLFLQKTCRSISSASQASQCAIQALSDRKLSRVGAFHLDIDGRRTEIPDIWQRLVLSLVQLACTISINILIWLIGMKYDANLLWIA